MLIQLVLTLITHHVQTPDINHAHMLLEMVQAFFESNNSHNNDVIMSAMASQVTSLTIVCSTVYSGADRRKHQSSTSRAFVRGIHRWPVNSPHKGPVTRKTFPLDDVIMGPWSPLLMRKDLYIVPLTIRLIFCCSRPCVMKHTKKEAAE